MKDTVIKIDNLSKEYQLGVISHKTLYHEVQSWLSKIMKKEDPNALIVTNNNRKNVKGDFLALDNISLEVKKGDILGIIGKNGAGKSTLLKILARVTSPSSGEVSIKGRIASLLEVGTGFHPELTGRENVFLNGAILGMTKKEILSKFDEIVDFSGIGEFIDTPVKRYSSGMYVRLAFAVAAHLDPDILIVDEVLAVGDAEFRKKCLGKMSEVSKIGRTILFVSHDMSAISALCTKGILLSQGKIVYEGSVEGLISEYTDHSYALSSKKVWNENERPGDNVAKLNSVRLINSSYQDISLIKKEQKFGLEIIYEIIKDGYRPNPAITIYLSTGHVVFNSFPKSELIKTKKGVHKAVVWFPDLLFNNESFYIRIAAHTFNPIITHFDLMDVITFEIIENKDSTRFIEYDCKEKVWGPIAPQLQWDIE